MKKISNINYNLKLYYSSESKNLRFSKYIHQYAFLSHPTYYKQLVYILENKENSEIVYFLRFYIKK